MPDETQTLESVYAGSPVPFGPRPWSKAAIAGFVCSLLGCLGITALFGLVFGIVGVVVTSKRQRRGFGLAVAAIPLSLFSGLASGLLLMFLVFTRQAVQMPEKIEDVFSHVAQEPSEAGRIFRGLASSDFNATVSEEKMAAWFEEVKTKHGTLTKVLIDPNTLGLSTSPNKKIVYQSLRGRFVNGLVDLRVTFAKGSAFSALRIDDIEIGGSSPRGPDTEQKP